MTVVAIDGPAGSGKSTIAAALAARLGVPHVDTGAFYRAATLAALRAGADPQDPDAVLAALAGARIDRRAGRTLLDGEDVEEEIRGPAVTRAVSAVSAHPAVRTALLDAQRAGVTPAGAVVEGRDAGTVVVPHADLKVWLTATPRERASRRAAQAGSATTAAVAAHEADIARRDALDAGRMVPASGVIAVDTTDRDVDAIVADLVSLARSQAERPAGP
ncbi:MAG: (d)CMP kinase [Euzebyaceae bacterium]|nr:(d)CMP kinase [Euzebyaceae bacterium]